MRQDLAKFRRQAGALFTSCSALFTQPNIFPILLFAVALGVRVVYLMQSEHRVLQFGDAFYYLTTGTVLAKAIATSTDWPALLQQMTSSVPLSPDDTSAFLSEKLPMRLVLDGPIYPGYLALVASVCGFAAQVKLQFNDYALQVSLANSFIDACCCLLIYFLGSRAFGRKIGAVAALIFAFYPAAMINLERAYSEPFAYFLLLALLSCALFARVSRLPLAVLSITAVIFGLLIAGVTLAKPVFVLVVTAIIVALVFSEWLCMAPLNSQWYQIWCSKRRLAALFLSVIGAALIFYPWGQITAKSLGKPTLLVSRAPAYNLFVGNQLFTDGWRIWPYMSGYNGELKKVLEDIGSEFEKQPLEMLALELKKIPRLWAGGWNEFFYPFFGITFEQQNIFHGVLLFFACLGVCLVGSRIRAEKTLVTTFVGISALLIIGVHFLYLAFEPISRYAITAMPFVCLFAAVTVVSLFRQRAWIALLLLGGAGGVFFGLLESRASCAPIILETFPDLGIAAARIMEEAAILVLWFILAHIFIRALAAAKCSLVAPQSRLLLMLCFGFASLSWFSCAHFDLSKGEWYCDLRTQMQTFSQEEMVPPEKDLAAWLTETKDENALDPLNTVFLLVDLEHEMGQPAVTLTLNHTIWRTIALPWYEVLGKTGDIPIIMNMQGSAMGKDWRSFRQWWAIPVPRGMLKPGQANEIAIGFVFAESPLTVRIFGDYYPKEETDAIYLPSFEMFSWTRGFATYDTHDTRVFEMTPGLSKVTNPALWFTRKSESQDLSTEPGLQSGAYRIRIAIPRSPGQGKSLPPATSQNLAVSPDTLTLPPLKPEQFEECAPVSIGKHLEDITIDGGNPQTYMLFKESQKLPHDLRKGAIVDFGCLLKSDRKRQSGPITVVFEGRNEKGVIEKWSSPWQPTAVSCDAGWRRFNSSYLFPDHMLGMKDLAVNVMVSPFSTDELVMKKRKALHEVMVIKDATLTLCSPLKMPAGKKLDWMIF